jgi:hypothetical protein
MEAGHRRGERAVGEVSLREHGDVAVGEEGAEEVKAVARELAADVEEEEGERARGGGRLGLTPALSGAGRGGEEGRGVGVGVARRRGRWLGRERR